MHKFNHKNPDIKNLFARALAAQDQGLLEAAAATYEQVLQHNPDHLEALFNRAVIDHEQNRLEKALRGYQKALAIQPGLAPAHKNIGDIRFSLQEFDTAAAAYEASLKSDPDQAGTWNNLGMLEKHRRNYDNAAKAWRRALDLQPDHKNAGQNLARILKQQGKYEEALTLNRQICQRYPEDNDSKLDLALIQHTLGALGEAAEICTTILRHNPDNAETLNILGLIHLQQGNPEAAIATLRLALEHQPQLPRVHSNLLYAMLMDPKTTPDNYLREARCWWETHGLEASRKMTYSHRRRPPENRKLHLGFISADFRQHSVSFFLLPLLKALRNGQFTIYGYADLQRTDNYSCRLREQMDFWRPIFGLEDNAVGSLIEDDEIDILIELGGHTANNRLTLIAQKPAPIQISWLGYPAGCGLANGTFRLSDSYTDPIANDAFSSEQLLRLPGPFLCYAPPPEALTLTGKTEKRPLTFGSFNNPAKINYRVISVWAGLLRQIPGSRLILKAKIFSDLKTRNIFEQRFKKSDIALDRIEFRPGNPNLVDHFNSYNDIDIALDTFPYNGTTTTCEALWMGVPVITIRGITHAARVGADLMNTVGCPELIADDENSYIEIATSLAVNPERLRRYHENLRSDLQNSPLMQAENFAAGFTKILTACRLSRRESDSPRPLDATINRVQSLIKQEKFDKARKILEEAIEQNPKEAELYFQLANIHHQQRQPEAALRALNSCLTINPRDARALSNLGYLMQNQGKHDEAAAAFKKALAIDPEQPETVSNLFWYLLQDCQWREAGIWNKKLDFMNYLALKKNRPPAAEMFVHLAREESEAANSELARAKARHTGTGITQLNHQPLKERAQVLKLAYLSGDFRDHAVAHNLVNLFRLHNRDRFHISAYSCGPDDGSLYRRRIEKDCDRFVDIQNLPDYDAAALIKNDKIDILIELMGHTRDNRLRLCAFKPAPVQVSYLGYPGTTGADFIDYLLADKIVIPPEHKPFYSEKIVYLPDCFMIADRAPIAPRPERRACGLPPDTFVFCSFNNAYKIEPVMFDIWMKILKEVPKSVLWLRSGGKIMENNLRREAQNRGISGNRLIFADKVPEKKNHLARLQLADLCLDTRIYNGHTTTLDALWAGVPVVALQGKHFASRVSSSNLTAIGMEQLITHDLENYFNLAVTLARQPQRLIKIKKELLANQNKTPLFNTENLVKNLEKAYEQIWQGYKNRKPKTAIEIKP